MPTGAFVRNDDVGSTHAVADTQFYRANAQRWSVTLLSGVLVFVLSGNFQFPGLC